MEFQILGPIAVIDRERRIDLAAAKEKALLVALILHPGKVLSAERLIDDLWDGHPPESASVSLRVHISRLRKALGDGTGRIVTRGSGYLFDLAAADEVDAHRFELLLKEAAASSVSDPERASASYGEALALWRGRALDDLADMPFARPDAVRLEEARLNAIEGRLEAELACGRHAGAAAELDSLCASHPLRERIWGLRMLALYRCGRQAEALRAYQQLRSHLAEELGLQPGPELARMESEILAQSPALDWQPPSRTPASSTRVGLPTGVVTFLMTDIEGSTPLWEAHGPQMAQALERHDALVLAAVESGSGSLLKTKGEGDATLSAFGRASDAAATAVALQQAFAVEPWPEGLQLRVRMALHTGEAQERNGDYFGPTLNRAARIRGLATGGQILLSQATAEVVRDRLPVGCELADRGQRVLTGLSRPEWVWELVPEGDAVGYDPKLENPVVPLPSSLSRGTAIPFVGRDAELRRLEGLWAAARGGRRQAVLVAGEPGIGKTELVAALARDCYEQAPTTVLFGHCDEESLVPFQPFVEALAHFVRVAPLSLLERVLGGHAADLALLVPEVRQRFRGLPPVSGLGPETDRYRLFEAVPTLLGAIAGLTPVMLVVDDLHWADRPTLQLLTHTIRRTVDIPLLVVGTYRDTDLDRRHPMAHTLVELRRTDAILRLTLRGLPRDDVERLVGGPSHPDPSQLHLAHALWSETEGNPLFLRESLRHLDESGAVIRERDGSYRPKRQLSHLGIPEGVKEVIGRRLTRLSDAANAVLRTASVIGNEFRPELVARAADLPLDAVLDTLDDAATAGIVSEVAGRIGRYRFTHSVVRHALHDELSLTRQVLLHRRVGEVIEQVYEHELDDHLTELAYHFGQAAAAGLAEKAVDYGRRAAEQAMSKVAYEEAERHFALALEAAIDGGASDSVRADLLLGVGAAQWRSRHQATAQDTFEQAADIARRTGDAERLAEAALGYAGAAMRWIWANVNGNQRTIELLEEALVGLDKGDSATRARVLAALGMELHFDMESEARRSALSDEAVAMARRVGDPAVLYYVLGARCLSIMSPDTTEERLSYVDEGHAAAAPLGDLSLEAWAQSHRYVLLTELDRIPEARRESELALSAAQSLHDPVFLALNLYTASMFVQLEGQLSDGEDLLRKGFAAGERTGDPSRLLIFGGLLMLRWLQGRLDEEVGMFDAFADVPQIWGMISEGAVGLTRAWIYAELGELDAAARQLDEYEHKPVLGVARLFAWGAAARACHLLGDSDRAVRMYGVLAPYRDRNVTLGGIACFGSVTHVLGLLAATMDRPALAREHFEEALERYRTNGWWALVAETEADYAALLARSDLDADHQRAAELATDALRRSEEIGMATVNEQARWVQSRLGGPADGTSEHRRGSRGMSRRDRARARVTSGGRRAVARIISGESDDDLLRRFGSTLAQRAMFTAMARSFQPTKAKGFEGDITFELEMNSDEGDALPPSWWTIEVRGRKAAVRKGASAQPAICLRLGLTDLLKFAAGQPPVDAMVNGRLEVRGDVLLLTRLVDMFGAGQSLALLEKAPV